MLRLPLTRALRGCLRPILAPDRRSPAAILAPLPQKLSLGAETWAYLWGEAAWSW